MSRARDLGSSINSTVAGRNKIINGDFLIWQRGTTGFASSDLFNADRWRSFWNGSTTITMSRETFTPGSAPVSGYEGQYFLRMTQSVAGSGGTYILFAQQRIEDVRILAGQRAVLSFWAKSDSNRNINVGIRQNFGSGGSAESYPNVLGNPIQTSNSWQRYSFAIDMSSVSGKTIGASNYVAIDIYATAVNIIQTIDIWGVQLESGSSPTTFSRAGGDIQGELAKCQRYYQRWNFTNNGDHLGNGQASGSSSVRRVNWPTKVIMRANPSIPTHTGTIVCYKADGSGVNLTSLGYNGSTTDRISVDFGTSASAGTAGDYIFVLLNNGAYFEASAEL